MTINKALFLVFLGTRCFSAFSQLSDEDKKVYQAFIIRETRTLSLTLQRICQEKDNPEVVRWGMEVLDGIFMDTTDGIFHQFPGHEAPVFYTYRDFVKKIAAPDYYSVGLKWDLFRDSITISGLITYNTEDNLKVYNDSNIKLQEDFLIIEDGGKIISNTFNKQVIFRLFEVSKMGEKRWYLKVTNIKSTKAKPNCRRDKDNDGVNDCEDDCPSTPGVKENKGCPYKDSDGDLIPDQVDLCPQDYAPGTDDGCPPDNNGSDTITAYKCGLWPLVPSLGDKKVKGKNGTNWIWGAGIVTSAGAGTYYLCEALQYGGNLRHYNPGDGKFVDYRKARLARQNAYVFYSIAALIAVVDIGDSFRTCGKNRQILGNAGMSWQPVLKVENLGESTSFPGLPMSSLSKTYIMSGVEISF